MADPFEEHVVGLIPARTLLVADQEMEIDADSFRRAKEQARADKDLQRLGSELKRSGGLSKHENYVRTAFQEPNHAGVIVADVIALGIAGAFSPRSREITLDRQEAVSLLRDKDLVSPTLIHELVHAAQPRSISAANDEQVERWLLEGSTDAMAALIVTDQETTVELPEMGGPVYGPFEAVTRAALDVVAHDDKGWFGLISEFAALPLGSRIAWLANRHDPASRAATEQTLQDVIVRLIRLRPPSGALVSRTPALWEFEKNATDMIRGALSGH